MSTAPNETQQPATPARIDIGFDEPIITDAGDGAPADAAAQRPGSVTSAPRSTTPPPTPKSALRPNPNVPHMWARTGWLRPGRVRPMILLWALGVPIPIIILVLLLRSCM